MFHLDATAAQLVELAEHLLPCQRRSIEAWILSIFSRQRAPVFESDRDAGGHFVGKSLRILRSRAHSYAAEQLLNIGALDAVRRKLRWQNLVV